MDLEEHFNVEALPTKSGSTPVHICKYCSNTLWHPRDAERHFHGSHEMALKGIPPGYTKGDIVYLASSLSDTTSGTFQGYRLDAEHQRYLLIVKWADPEIARLLKVEDGVPEDLVTVLDKSLEATVRTVVASFTKTINSLCGGTVLFQIDADAVECRFYIPQKPRNQQPPQTLGDKGE